MQHEAFKKHFDFTYVQIMISYSASQVDYDHLTAVERDSENKRHPRKKIKNASPTFCHKFSMGKENKWHNFA